MEKDGQEWTIQLDSVRFAHELNYMAQGAEILLVLSGIE